MANSSSTSSSDRPQNGRIVFACVATALILGHIAFRPPVVGAPALPARIPYNQVVFTIDPDLISGLSQRSRLIANGQGLRGQVLGKGAFNVLIIGGSTVQCALLDESDSLVTRVIGSLRETQREGRPIRIATPARGGYRLKQINADLASLLAAEDTAAQLVVAMPGANDLEEFVTGVSWATDERGDLVPEINPESPFSSRNWAETYAGWYAPGSTGAFAERVRSAYAESPWQGSLDERKERIFQTHLRRYDQSLSELARITNQADAPLMLVTQPLNYAGNERGARVADWMPFYYPKSGVGFIPSPALFAELLRRVNNHTRAFSEVAGVPLLDLDAELTGCADCFYDQWHFNVEGSKRAGRQIAEFIDQPIRRR